MKKYLFLITNLLCFNVFSQELVIGEERIEPGIKIIFEGAIKDMVFPKENNLEEEKTNVHIEARVNWDFINTPKGTPSGGFVPYLNIIATVTNQSIGLKTFVDLTPHINLVDNFHYARNISLPGSKSDLYTVEFSVSSPGRFELSYHKDWKDNYSDKLIDDIKFEYENISFEEIANSSRR